MEPEIAKQKYRSCFQPLHTGFASRLETLMHELLKSSLIAYAQVQARVKTFQSFTEKIRRKKYQDPFQEMKDLTGIRIVTYYCDDVKKVEQLLSSEFSLEPDHSMDKMEELEVDEFGYRSLHVIISLCEPRKSLPEWREYSDLYAEIQIRSVLQHAWASISHKLDYKKASQAPIELRRKLFRLSALLELADDEFAAIRDRSREILEKYTTEVEEGVLDMPLDLESLRAFLTERKELVELEDVASDVGLSTPSQEERGYIREMELRHLLLTLQSLNAQDLNSVDALIKEALPQAHHLLSLFAEQSKSLGEQSFGADFIDALTLILTLYHSDKFVSNFEPGGMFRPGIKRTIRKFISEYPKHL